MNQSIDKHLVKAIANIAIFLEFSEEDILNPDSAVEALEQLGAELQLLPNGVKHSLVQQLRNLAEEYSDKKTKFLKNLPETLGLL